MWECRGCGPTTRRHHRRGYCTACSQRLYREDRARGFEGRVEESYDRGFSDGQGAALVWVCGFLGEFFEQFGGDVRFRYDGGFTVTAGGRERTGAP